MTKIEHEELVTAIDSMRITLEKARYLMQEIDEEYFEQFEPKKDQFSILHGFCRYRAFVRLLDDCIRNLESEIPSEGWLQQLAATN